MYVFSRPSVSFLLLRGSPQSIISYNTIIRARNKVRDFHYHESKFQEPCWEFGKGILSGGSLESSRDGVPNIGPPLPLQL